MIKISGSIILPAHISPMISSRVVSQRSWYTLIFTALLSVILALPLPLSAEDPESIQTAALDTAKPTVNVGILAFRPKPEVIARWQPLIDYFNAEIPSAHFVLNTYTNQELDNAVANNELDFIFAQPSHYVRLTYTHSLSSPLATLVNRQGQDTFEVFAGVILTRSDRNDITALSDLRGKTIAAPSTEGLGGFQMQAYELLQAGIGMKDYRVLVTDQPQDRVIAAVLDGSADAGFVRTGLIEAMSRAGKLDPQQFKVLNPNTRRLDFPFAASTRFYPEWPFAAMTHVEHDLARQVAAGLLAIPHGGELAESMRIHGFTIPGDYRNIDQLLRTLRMPPFDDVPFVTLQDIWENWKSLIITALFLLGILLILALFYLFYRNRHLLHIQRELQDYIAENQKLKLAVEQSPVSIALTDLQSRVLYINHAFTQNTGYRPEEIHGKKMNIFKSDNTPPQLFQQLWTSLLDGKSWHGEMASTYKDGQEHDEELVVSPITNADGDTFAYLTIKQDITERKRSEAHIHRLAYYDQLTGLANRALLTKTLAAHLREHQRHLVSRLLLLINIDRFKVINDARGHVFGDALLHALGQRLHSLVQDKDALVARISADEYAIMLSCDASKDTPDVNKIMSIADEIHVCVAQPFLINGELLTIAVSLGMVTFNNACDLNGDEVLQRADTALHHARSAGGNQSALFEPGMLNQISNQFLLDKELREAIRSETLDIYLQPQFDTNGELYGAEALVRWPHPTRGMVPPSLFIPMAEKSDLIVDLSEYVFRKSFLLLAESQRQGHPLHIAINVSPRHCRKSNLVEWIVALVEETGVDLGYLTLEITEGLFIGNLEMVSQRMKLLHAMGIRFSIDDFGTGYSSLSYLKQLPIHELKIDKSFIQDAPHNTNSAALVEAILAVAKHMELVVVAEGVETQEQHAYIKRHHGVIQQGFLLGRPQPGKEWLDQWIASQKSRH